MADSNVPQSVKDQAKKAEELQKQAYGKGEADKGTPPKVEEPAKAPEKVEPAKETPVVANNQPILPVPGAEDFEQKYRVMQGKYDAEVPVLRTQITDLTEQVRKLAENKTSEPAKEPENFKEAVKVMEEQYGPEFTDMVNNAAAAKATEISNRLIDEKLKDVTDRVNNVAEVQVQSAEDRFMSSLDKGLGEGWKTGINKDPGFLAWLNKPIDAELGNETYMDKLTGAYNVLDDATILTIFNRYIKGNPQALAEKEKASKLEELVVPDGQGGGGDNVIIDDLGKKTYTPEEFSQINEAIRRGEYSEEEVTKIETDLALALSEGRVG